MFEVEEGVGPVAPWLPWAVPLTLNWLPCEAVSAMPARAVLGMMY